MGKIEKKMNLIIMLPLVIANLAVKVISAQASLILFAILMFTFFSIPYAFYDADKHKLRFKETKQKIIYISSFAFFTAVIIVLTLFLKIEDKENTLRITSLFVTIVFAIMGYGYPSRSKKEDKIE